MGPGGPMGPRYGPNGPGMGPGPRWMGPMGPEGMMPGGPRGPRGMPPDGMMMGPGNRMMDPRMMDPRFVIILLETRGISR